MSQTLINPRGLFCDSGHSRQKTPPGEESTPQEEMNRVKVYFEGNRKAHLREAARELDMAIGKICTILRKGLMWKAHRPHTAQVLTQIHSEPERKEEKKNAACE